MIDIRTLRIQAKLMSAFSDLRAKRIIIKSLEDTLFLAAKELEDYCDNSFPYEKNFVEVVVGLAEEINDEAYFYWFGIGKHDISYEAQKNIPDELNDNLCKYFDTKICNLEKLIIRGSEEGAPVTDEERAAWWKMQKEQEREEFYKLNGYYEDET